MNTSLKAYSVGILAGGKSSRMGKNKALLEFESDTFIGHAVKEAILSAGLDVEDAVIHVEPAPEAPAGNAQP